MQLKHAVLSFAAVWAFGIPVANVGAAEQYPSRPVRMVVPFQPGGASDFVARIIEPNLAQELRQPVVQRRLATAGAIAIVSESPRDFRKFWESEHNRWSKVVPDIGAVAQ